MAFEPWARGLINCMVILMVVVALWFVTMRRPRPRVCVFLITCGALLLCVDGTKYIAPLRGVVYEPIQFLGNLF